MLRITIRTKIVAYTLVCAMIFGMLPAMSLSASAASDSNSADLTKVTMQQANAYASTANLTAPLAQVGADLTGTEMPATTNNGFIAPIDPIPSDVPEENIVHITTAEELAAIGNTTGIYAKYYVLDNDINLTSEWVPIDNFYGTLDGQGHSINNLYILKSSNISSAGLFGYTAYSATGTIIKNVAVNIGESGIFASSYAGGIVGEGDECNIINCYVTGNVSSAATAGGIAGDSYAHDGIYSEPFCKITKCYATGDISAVSDGSAIAGGIIGDGVDDGMSQSEISNCYATGNVSASSINGSSFAGGLIGRGDSYSDGIKNCCATGNVSSVSTSANTAYAVYAGGLIGYMYICVMSDCYATGNVNANSSSVPIYAGGCIGSSVGYGSIKNCYSIGEVMVEGIKDNVYKGGFAGYYASAAFGNSYYNSETSGCSDNIGYGAPKTTAEMKNIITYENWDFEEIWDINPTTNNGYPYLQSLRDSYTFNTINVSVPDGDTIYKNYILRVTAENYDRSLYVTGDVTSVQIPDTSLTYKIELLSPIGILFGTVENINPSENSSVDFTNLPVPKTVILTLKDKDGGNVSSGYTVNWYESGKTQVLTTGSSVAGLISGMALRYEITLDSTLSDYEIPDNGTITVSDTDSDNNITVNLVEIRLLTITGVVTSGGIPVADASVTLTSNLASAEPYESSVTTNVSGEFTAQAYAGTINIYVSKFGYADYNTNITVIQDGVIPDIDLVKVDGLPVSLAMDYTASYTSDDTPFTIQLFSAKNINFTLYNNTQNKEITEFTLSGMSIVIQDNTINLEDVIKISAVDITGNMANAETTFTIQNSANSASLSFLQNGSWEALGYASANSNDMALLYDNAGKYVATYYSNGNSFTSGVLPAGTYNIVFIGNSQLIRQLANLSDFAAVGLIENTDYIKKTVDITPGTISVIDSLSIPKLDEMSLYYTNANNTSVTANKTGIAVGSLIMIRAEYSFDAKYAKDTSNFTVSVSIPDGCVFVSNSVTLDGVQCNYRITPTGIEVQTLNPTGIVRFYVMPVTTGSYAVNAFINFTYQGNQMLQPIGTAVIEAVSLTIQVPEKTGNKTVYVSGVAEPKSAIKVFDNDVEVESTEANAFGSWNMYFDLVNSYTYSYHEIYAEVTPPSTDVTVKTEVKELLYNITSADISKVTMINFAHAEQQTVFDFIHPNPIRQIYYFNPGYPLFTFTVELTNPDAASAVYVITKDSDGNSTVIETAYDSTKGLWIGTHEYNSYNVPVSIEANYSSGEGEQFIIDREMINDANDEINNLLNFDFGGDEETNDEIRQIISNQMPDLFDGISISDNNMSYSIGDMNVNMETSSCYGLSEEQLINDGYSVVTTTSGKILAKIDTDTGLYTMIDIDNNLKYQIQSSLNEPVLRILKTAATSANLDASEILDGINKLNGYIDKANSILNELGQGIKSTIKFLSTERDKLPNFSAKRIPFTNAIEVIEKISGVLETANKFFGVIDLESQLSNLMDLKALYSKYKDCPDSDELIGKIKALSVEISVYSLALFGDIMIKFGLIDSVVVNPSSAIAGVAWIIVDLFARTAADYLIKERMNEIRQMASEIKCNPCPPGAICINPDGNNGISGSGNAQEPIPAQDPSGYVYEAVPSNRLSGVKTTVYHSASADGSNPEVWDASEYDQANPLYTDSDGQYAWDVPFGWWQVKYEKDGYDTTYSDWLPVPPPQTEINIGMTSTTAPTVKSAAGYEDYIEIVFDKYMDTSLLTKSNIVLSGYAGDYDIAFVGAEQDPNDSQKSYTRIVRIIPLDDKFTVSDTLGLAINKSVESYAGVNMADNYQCDVKIALEPKTIYRPTSVSLNYGEIRTISVTLLPAEAGINKKITAVSNSPMLVSVNSESVTDNNSTATFTLVGEMSGTAEIALMVEGTQIVNTISVDVALPNQTAVDKEKAAKPTANLTGDTVVTGTELILTTATEGATIYYTTDGSCPCSVGTRQTYTGPITLTKDVSIYASAYKEGMDYSPVLVLNFTVVDQLPTYTITATAGIGGTVSGGGTFDLGDSVTLTATPNSGYTFDGWYENNAKVSANATYTFTATTYRTLEARFTVNSNNNGIYYSPSSGGSGVIESDASTTSNGNNENIILNGSNLAVSVNAIKNSYGSGGISFKSTSSPASTLSIPASLLTSTYADTKSADKPFVFTFETPVGTVNIPVNITSLIPNYNTLTAGKGDISIKVTVTDMSASEKVDGALSPIVEFKLELIDENGAVIAGITNFTGNIERIIPLNTSVKPKYYGAYTRKDSKSAWGFVPHKWAGTSSKGSVVIQSNTNSEYVVVEYTPKFTDVAKTAWYYDNVTLAAAKKLVNGMNDEGTIYSPESQVTRAEFIQMMANALRLPQADAATTAYSDVTSDKWYYNAIMQAKSAGLLAGLSSVNGNF
ncbi:MAG: S-layer homology domain-containing protein, partial [Oscillospiraceae bacterium]|nr:S-layer homology domain-containing protein [Oscillospiraceae bacterium]